MNAVRDWVALYNEEALLADGFDDAIIGVVERVSQEPVAVYDAEKCVEILMGRGMDHDEATEFFYFNTLGAWVGEMTPVFMWPWRPDDDEEERA